jgi:hypothetical protein
LRRESGEPFRRDAAATRAIDVQVIITVGSELGEGALSGPHALIMFSHADPTSGANMQLSGRPYENFEPDRDRYVAELR